ncbi:FMN-binding negative transcriptional regulator [Phenylobacterium sp.]|uniref:FMN-binding negative transcriptional regulator n=1 Tax=Phenylobacterium sp. TaxID=1871053 RepID=UPI00286BB50E|nr:FMN-binding negative transcriptional regulator [Phenylobacterium sp.]
MHPTSDFRVEDEGVLLSQLAARPLVILAAIWAGRPLVAHAPVVVRRLSAGLALDFHLSRGNALAPALAIGVQAVAVSLAADAYISPDWYKSADQVPTWNYVSVEAEGSVEPLDEAGLIALLDDLSAQEEARLAPKAAWTRAKMSAGRFEAMLRGIVGGRMRIERLEGTSKLSQNKDDADRAGVIAALGDHPIADLMPR